MRSALICVFFTLIVRSQEASETTSEFRPTPIPLSEWPAEQREERTNNVKEPVSTATTAARARYWEDALRHSVYLTLVRDKIDQLIAQGEVISPDKIPEPYMPKDIDDHDLWEKIKTAPFERIVTAEPDTYGDVTILAKGRLLQDKDTYKFAEDDKNTEKCYIDSCMDGVKVIWSVKRVRQRDSESSLGMHHYELTFSVISQPAKNQKKPYENPIRTFTVREKQEKQNHYHTSNRYKVKPTRMMWFHKNIVPTPQYHRQSLDRIFSSLFFDDEDEPRQRPYVRHPTYGAPGYNQFSKVPHLGSSNEQFPHKKPLQPPYKIRHNVMKLPWHAGGQPGPTTYTSELLPSPYPSQSKDYNTFVLPIQPAHAIKSNTMVTTPSTVDVPPNNTAGETSKELSFSTTDSTTKTVEVLTLSSRYPTYSRTKTPPMKVKYYPQHIRPPVYNAPPGVFVTMDKKPFKPMPPIKLIHGKPVKTSRPTDFRPSPQVLDVQFSEPDPFSDTAFRPITVNYDENATTETVKSKEYSNQHEDRRPNLTSLKPPKKHENIKAQKTTTSAPEIITAHNEIQDIENPGWNVLGAFSKTTPLANADTEKIQTIPKEEYTTTRTTTTTTTQPTTTTAKKRTSKITTSTVPPETTTAHNKPIKRTRPPPEFKKDERKEKKSKRRTTTSTKAPDTSLSKIEHDLTPQASSAATSSSKLQKDSTKTPTTTTTTNATPKNTTIMYPTAHKNEGTTIAYNTQPVNATTTIKQVTKITTTQVPTTTNKIVTNDSKTNGTVIKDSTIKTLTSNAVGSSTVSTNPTTSKASTNSTISFAGKAVPKITSKTTTTTTETPTTTVLTKTTSTTQPKNKNRFRQSTLMQKGTSVNHDKWSFIPPNVDKTKSTVPVSGAYPPRRKGSNFQGYISSTPKNTELDDSENHISSPYMSKTSTTQKPATAILLKDTYLLDEVDSDSSASVVHDQILYPENDVTYFDGAESYGSELSSDTSDFMYDVIPLEAPTKKLTAQEEAVSTSTQKNKGKCKKKKSQNLSTTNDQETEVTTTTAYPTTTIVTTTSTQAPTTRVLTTSTAAAVSNSLEVNKTTQIVDNPDIFETLFGFNFDDEFSINNTAESSLNGEQSEINKRFLEPEEEYKRAFEKFTDRRQVNLTSEYDSIDYEEEKKPEIDDENDDSNFETDELKQLDSDQSDYTHFEDVEDQIDLLELIGME